MGFCCTLEWLDLGWFGYIQVSKHTRQPALITTCHHGWWQFSLSRNGLAGAVQLISGSDSHQSPLRRLWTSKSCWDGDPNQKDMTSDQLSYQSGPHFDCSERVMFRKYQKQSLLKTLLLHHFASEKDLFFWGITNHAPTEMAIHTTGLVAFSHCGTARIVWWAPFRVGSLMGSPKHRRFTNKYGGLKPDGGWWWYQK